MSIAGGWLYVCACDGTDDGQFGTAVPSSSHRFGMNKGLGETTRLADLTGRLRAHLEPLHLDLIVLTEVRRYSQWKYRDAYTHVLDIAALMTASHHLGIGFETVTTDKIAKVVGVPADKLSTVDFTRFGYADRPTYWTAGMGAAHAAAGYAVEGGAS